MPKKMDLPRVVAVIRRQRAKGIGQVSLILALLETGAVSGPYFEGMEEEELVISLCKVVREHIRAFRLAYEKADWDPSLFFKFMALECSQLRIECPDRLAEVYYNIEKQGVAYEFKAFERVG